VVEIEIDFIRRLGTNDAAVGFKGGRTLLVSLVGQDARRARDVDVV
jgi:hypothetical protein